jgi:mono/diheme cytochrome c family protein
MIRRTPVLLAAATTLAVLSVRFRPVESPSSPEAVERGRYLTHDVAMCVQCHSPRSDKGEIQRAQEFAGARIRVESPFPGPPWAPYAPNLRGLVGFSDEAMLRLLGEGIAHTGAPPQSPMPPFRLNRADATAIVAYLRSLK